MLRRTSKLIPATALALLAIVSGGVVLAASVTPEEITELQSEIQNRKAQIETINGRLEEYKKKIAAYSKQASSLQNDIAILENEMAMTELDIAATQNAIEEENLHLAILDANIEDADTKLAREKDLLNELIFEINKQDKQGGTFELIIGARNFNDVFTAASELQSVNTDLRKTLVATQQTRDTLEDKKGEREQRLATLSDLHVDLDTKIAQLDARVSAKEVLSMETQESELEYRVLLSELRQEQQGISQRINQLQEDIENRLAESDEEGGETTVISWPVLGRITTTFHDPTYPFRYLFEHGGLDIAVPQGTPIESAAPGYVAWAQTGRQYGNYVMVIHSNGFATLYAHMSRIDVEVDQYVTRGQIIGLSGGRPGTQGAGFSTGPHVHFELRKNGIPIDPMTHLP
ncbi:MAG: peptidoglycan DD-metalloendopeptidase family protein [Patescibacteria group bacterium]